MYIVHTKVSRSVDCEDNQSRIRSMKVMIVFDCRRTCRYFSRSWRQATVASLRPHQGSMPTDVARRPHTRATTQHWLRPPGWQISVRGSGTWAASCRAFCCPAMTTQRSTSTPTASARSTGAPWRHNDVASHCSCALLSSPLCLFEYFSFTLNYLQCTIKQHQQL